MKLLLELNAYDFSGQEDGKKKFIKLVGKDSRGVYSRAVLFDSAAQRLNEDLSRMLPPGSDVGSSRLVVELVGEWRTRDYTRPDKTPGRSRSFYADTFDVLTGPVLLMARIRRDAADKVALAEQHREAGRLDLAYRLTAEYLAEVSGRPLDLSDLEQVMSADDEAEFGLSETVDPEAAAAARFASMDAAEPMKIAEEAQIEPVSVSSEERDVLEDGAGIADTVEQEQAPDEIETGEVDDGMGEEAEAETDAAPGSESDVTAPTRSAPPAPARPAPPRLAPRPPVRMVRPPVRSM